MVTTAVVMISHRTEPGLEHTDANGPIEDRPPSFVPVANRPLLLHVLDSLEGAGIQNVVVASDTSLAGCAEQAAGAPDRWSFRLEHFSAESLTLAAAISASESLFGPRPLLVHLGDSLGRGLAQLLPVVPLKEHDGLLLVEEHAGPGATVVNLADGGLLALPGLGSLGAGWLPAGVGLFGAGIGDVARSLAPSGNHDFELVAAAQHIGSNGGRLDTRNVPDWYRLRGQRGGLLEANRFALEGAPRSVPEETMDEQSVAQGGVSIHPTARLASTVVRGPVVIGARVRLTDAYIGPYTSIAEDVVIEGAEVEHSIIRPGAQICHLGRRLEGSVIGPGAMVYRDFKLPNALRLHVGAGAEVSVH